MAQYRYKLGVAGAGKMGSALIKALVAREALRQQDIIAADVQPSAREGLLASCPQVTAVAEVAQAAADADVLLIAVKPQHFEAALEPAVAARPDGQLIVSVMAGIPISRIASLFGDHAPIVRAMPNIVCEVAEGAFGYAVNAHVSDEQKALVDLWLNSIGTAEELPEELLDAVTGLSGSGPAFAAMFIEALADGGVAAGLPRNVAQRLAAQTVLGAARWILEHDGPAQLKDMVCSPAGTTIAGVRALETGGIRAATMEAVIAAARRSQELGT